MLIALIKKMTTKMNFMMNLFWDLFSNFTMVNALFIILNFDFIMAKLLVDFRLKSFLDKLKDTFDYFSLNFDKLYNKIESN